MSRLGDGPVSLVGVTAKLLFTLLALGCVEGMSDALEARIKFGRTAVAQQIDYFVKQFGAVDSKWKSDGSRVTEADLYLSSAFARSIAALFSEDLFLSEELDHGETPIPVGEGYAWLLDPIDGTNNFARRMPTCSISLALLKDGNPVYGYIYDHASRKLLEGGEGRGLFIDGERYERPELELNHQSLIAIQSLAKEEAMAEENALQMKFKLRAIGSSALHMAYAAYGWSDGVIAHRVKSWDIAAGVAMMKAIGGHTRFFDTEVFPVREFSSKADGFSHIAGTVEMCDAIEETIGRKCRYVF